MRQSLLHRLAPGLLVVLWSSGFVGATFAAPTAPATTTLLWRYVVAAPLMVAVVLVLRRRYGIRYLRREATLGLLGQAGYLYGVFRAVEEGLPAGTAALLASLQPALVAVALAGLRRGSGSGPAGGRRQAVGLAVGFVGVALAVGPGSVAGTGAAGALWALGGMLSLSTATLLGSLWPAPGPPQERQYDVLDSLTVQSTAALAAFTVVAFAGGQAAPPADPVFWLAVAWLVCLAFLGGYGMYLYVQRTRGPVAVSTWLYLTPAVSAAWAWAMFGEELPLLTVAGFAVSLTGVLLTRPARQAPEEPADEVRRPPAAATARPSAPGGATPS
ncbi:DMT family transporter [Promicromonospora sp. NPDC050880]|uniref:DMT family transporter n=1 Tax=Promicromonospora sp. NPDC050880 TaxID=3364406 RepID=UPI0037A28161